MVALFIATFTAISAPVRIAIIGDGTDTAAAVDSLTVTLSKESSIVLLDRSEVDRVYREQSLAAGPRDDIKLGQVLGANGVLVLSKAADTEAAELSLRLLAVGPGVVIAAVRSPWPPTDMGKWAEGITPRVAALAPKLAVSAGEAIPLSLVNLHSALQSLEGKETERKLSVLAFERLSHEPEVFVLERQRMELLSAEKELQGNDKSPFWDGSYLLEGVLDRDGYSPATVTLNARLVPPKGGAPIEIGLSGSRTNLPALADQLAQKILATLKLQSTGTPWNAVEEAQRYFAEAQWAHRWGLYAEAAADCESSWALGMDKEVAELRTRSWLLAGIDNSGASIDLDGKLIAFMPAAPPSRAEFIRPEYPSFAAGVVPDAARFGAMRRALEVYGESFRRFVLPEPKPPWAWHDLGLDLLEYSSRWLLHYYYTPEARAGQEGNIAAVRELTQDVARLIASHPAFTNDRPTRPQSEQMRGRYSEEFDRRFNLPTIRATWGGYWYATPEEGVENYRELLAAGWFPRIRTLLMQPDFLERTRVDAKYPSSRSGGGTLTEGPLSYLAGWTAESRLRAVTVWHRLIDEWCASTNTTTRAEGLFLRCAQALTDEQHDRAFAELLQFLERAADKVADATCVAHVEALIGSKPRQGFTEPALDKRKQAWALMKPKLNEASARLAREAEIRLRLNYLSAGEYDSFRFSRLFSQSDWSSNEARVLLPAFSAYRTNIAALKLKAADEAEAARPEAFGSERSIKSRLRITELENSKYSLAQLEQSLLFRLTNSGPLPTPMPTLTTNVAIRPMPAPRGVAGPGMSPITGSAPGLPGSVIIARSNVPPYSPRFRDATSIAKAGMPGGFGPGPMGHSRQGIDPASLALTNVLVVDRFWPFPTSLPGIDRPFQLDIANCFYREGRLWVDARYVRLGSMAGDDTFFNRGVVLSLDLETFQSEAIVLDPAMTRLPGRIELRGERMFDVHAGFLYVSSENAIRRYSLKTKTWETLPVPIQGHGRICVVGDRLLLATEDSLLEVVGAEARILASTRRRPARSLLDSLEAFHLPPVVEGPAGALRTVIAGSAYELAQGASDWVAIPTPEAVKGGTCAAFADGLLLVSSPYGPGSGSMRQMVGLPTSARAPMLLLEQERDRRFSGTAPGLPPPAQSPARSASPQWPLPMGIYALNYPACLDGNRLWIFAGSLPVHLNGALFAWDEAIERHAVLFGLDPGPTNAFALGLKFKKPAVKLGTSIMGMASSAFAFEPTPAGLVVARSIVPGLWVIPRAEIERQLHAWRADRR